MKYLFFIPLLFASTLVLSQNTAITETQFVQIEMNKLQKNFNTPALTLSNDQISKIKTLLSQKYAKVYTSWNSGLSKLKMSERRTEIDKEYDPQIEGLLTSAQRTAIMKSKPVISN